MKNNLLKQAFQYSVRGYSVIPLRKNKLPYLASWKRYQTTPATDEELTAWWTKWPEANIGIVTGEISGITVVDIDVSGGKSVPLDTFPKTYTTKTPTSGYHLYYNFDPSVQQTANAFPDLPHVDIRNTGGFIVAPPSRCIYEKKGIQIDGNYTIERDIPLTDFPIALFHGKHLTDDVSPSVNHKQAEALLRSFKGMEEGDGRNVALTKYVGKILKITPQNDWKTTGWSVVMSLNQQFKKPLPEKEVKTIFNSISRRESEKPLSKVEFIKGYKGNIIVNEENVYRTIKNDDALKDCFRFNTFSGQPETNFNHHNGIWSNIQRTDVLAVQMYLMRSYYHFVRVTFGMIDAVINHYAYEKEASPAADWLSSLKWDKTKRLDQWLSMVYGTPDNEYHRTVGANWMKGLVKRVIYPGCKFDYVMVLEGKQGMKKSMSLGVLGGDWHVETTITPDNKDFFMIMAGKAIVEFSEGETLSRTDAKRLKAVITMQYDKYRPPYERAAKDFPRQCVFVMTTNQGQYLKDETGNRRWLPVTVYKNADIEWLAENREQLYAEAYYRAIIEKETTYEFPEEALLLEQEARQATDPKEEQIFSWYFYNLTEEERRAGISTRDAYVQGVQNLAKGSAYQKEMGRFEEMTVGTILREHLKLFRKKVRDGGGVLWRYFPTEESEKLKPEDANVDGFAVRQGSFTKSDVF